MWDQAWTLLEQRTFQDIQILPPEIQQQSQFLYFQPVNKGFSISVFNSSMCIHIRIVGIFVS
mgnify:CR=1 FL=1